MKHFVATNEFPRPLAGEGEGEGEQLSKCALILSLYYSC